MSWTLKFEMNVSISALFLLKKHLVCQNFPIELVRIDEEIEACQADFSTMESFRVGYQADFERFCITSTSHSIDDSKHDLNELDIAYYLLYVGNLTRI